MIILFDENNILPKSKKKKLRALDLFEDVMIPGGMVAIHAAKKVGLRIDSRVKVFKDRTDVFSSMHFKPYITTMRDFIS